MKLNKQDYLDKLYACWIGKNIGGTLGAPFEGTHDFFGLKISCLFLLTEIFIIHTI